MSEKKEKVKKTAKTKKRRTNRLFTRDQLFVFIILLVIIAAIIIGSIVLNKKGWNIDKENNEQNNQEQNNANESGNTLIDMENKANVEIKDGTKVNNSAKLKEEKGYAGMKIKDIQLYTSVEGMTNFSASVENTSGNDFASKKILIKFFNEDGSEYARLKAYLGDVKSGASTMINATTTADVSNAYNFEIVDDLD